MSGKLHTKGQVAQLSDTLHTSDKIAQHVNTEQNNWVTSCTTTEWQLAHQMSLQVAEGLSGDKLQNKCVVISWTKTEWWQVAEQMRGD